ncbi:MAG: group II intron maturase-specific domain-containing protein [Amphritea sp.]
MFESISHWIEKHLKLQVNRDKSGTGRPWQRKFLGFRLSQDGEIGIAPSRLEAYKARVCQLWDVRQSLTSRELVANWRRYVYGWWNYFGLAVDRLDRLSGWTRRHMRKCFWQRWHSRRGRINTLKRLGVKPRQLKRVGFHAGAWRAARHPAMHVGLSNSRLRQYHLVTPNDLAVS